MQVVKRIVPPMSNEIITLVKDTSLARIVMVYEIIWNAQKFAKTDGLLWPLFYTGAFLPAVQRRFNRDVPDILRKNWIITGVKIMSILEIKNMRKSFGKTEVLKVLIFRLKKGQVVSVIGSSGSGKTTFLRCINFLERADSGQVILDGKSYL